MTILTSTAYLDEAERCHRLALLHNGRLLFCDTPARLKARLPGAVLSIVTSEARAVRDALAHCEGVSSLMLVGDGVHLMVDDAARRLPELRQRMIAAALPFDQFLRVMPTIEDLFVASVQEHAPASTAP